MKPDIEIAQSATMAPIGEIAAKLGIPDEYLEPYGKYKAKVDLALWDQIKDRPSGKLILVTAITPTPAGEGKTTTTVGLGQALGRLGVKGAICIREPSLGPVMGIKGGAAGGGYAQVVPMEDINLHFTGDIHAVTAAHNLLAAMIDNHLQQGNALNIDPRSITWKRAMDMNERALRQIIIGLGGKSQGVPREDGFVITAASEIMAILTLASDLEDLKERIGRIVIGYTYDDKPVYARDLKAAGAMAALLKDAIKPNLVQTLENTPAFVHGGPFGNIAHGCNSIIATRLALKLADYVVTEAGFGADLGGEKFFDITCRAGGFTPDAVVVVATVRALKMHGGVEKEALGEENVEAVRRGFANLEKQVENMERYGAPVVVAVNRFGQDTDAELGALFELLQARGTPAALSDVFARGGEGGVDLAKLVLDTIKTKPANIKFLYDPARPIKEKIETIAREIYGADGVDYTRDAERDIRRAKKVGADTMPICMAKTQYSLSDDAKLLGRPRGFRITVREVRVSAGAGYVVPITGEIMTMPGLPKEPAAEKIDIDRDGKIHGLF